MFVFNQTVHSRTVCQDPILIDHQCCNSYFYRTPPQITLITSTRNFELGFFFLLSCYLEPQCCDFLYFLRTRDLVFKVMGFYWQDCQPRLNKLCLDQLQYIFHFFVVFSCNKLQQWFFAECRLTFSVLKTPNAITTPCIFCSQLFHFITTLEDLIGVILYWEK